MSILTCGERKVKVRAMSLPHALLGLLAVRPRSGYELTKAFEGDLGRYAWQAGHTSIYPELGRLAEQGLVEVTHEGARGSRTYAVTEGGRGCGTSRSCACSCCPRSTRPTHGPSWSGSPQARPTKRRSCDRSATRPGRCVRARTASGSWPRSTDCASTRPCTAGHSGRWPSSTHPRRRQRRRSRPTPDRESCAAVHECCVPVHAAVHERRTQVHERKTRAYAAYAASRSASSTGRLSATR